MYDLFCNYSGNETTALELADCAGADYRSKRRTSAFLPAPPSTAL